MRHETEQLGYPASTAFNQLKRILFWSLLVETNKIICFRCSQKMSLETFSVDHIKHWLYEDTSLFWDISNITYSHKNCNRLARRQMYKAKHGTRTMYVHHNCRCDPCKEANTIYFRV